ncbi:TPA: hypothetical protein JI393_RS14390 [Acinetobacter baumannii]|nr:hypothetical protein [Acinetobacter baumannii]HBI9064025.1 hypothetical protein [Acinetobacter baumannii]
MSNVVSKTDVLDDLHANIERFDWLNVLIGQVRKELKEGSPLSITTAKKLADIAHYLSDDYANCLHLAREDLEAELTIGGQQNG